MSTKPPHVCIIGTGMTALTIGRALLSHSPRLRIRLTFIDKARNPGGRLTSRTYADFGDVTLETGARAFAATSMSFLDEVESWERKGWVREIKLLPRGTSHWWQGTTGGLSKSLIQGMLYEIQDLADERVEFHYNTTVAHPSPKSATDLSLELEAPVYSLPAPDFVVHTAPLPQTSRLLPSDLTDQVRETSYAQTFAFLLPTIEPRPHMPPYERNPHPSLTSISSGIPTPPDIPTFAEQPVMGIVLQATPQQLGLAYDRDATSDDDIRRAFIKVLRKAWDTGPCIVPGFLIEQIESKRGKESQIKRWKFAQVADAVESDGVDSGGDDDDESDAVQVLAGGRVIVAGDGTAGGLGGVEGAWRAGTRAAEVIIEQLGKMGKL